MSLIDDKYTKDILVQRFNMYKQSYLSVNEFKKIGIPIRQQNPPEDITENMAKFIIRKYDNDPNCVWTKCLKLKGDLYSPKYDNNYQPEVKAFTSNGPSQFGPNKKFGVLYFLDLRETLDKNKIIMWKVKLTSDSPEFKNIKMSKSQTHQDQCEQGRRPHISWDKIYPQIKEHCEKIYEGTFEDIFE
jgi:hypothetical protein